MRTWRSLLSRDSDLPDQPDPHTPLIDAQDVTVTIDEHTILDHVSVRVFPGEVVALVGPNGAGKSTLLSVLSGDRAPQSGTIRVAQRPIREWNAVELAQRRSVLLQRIDIAFPFTVVDVVRMWRASWAGTSKENEDEATVSAVLRKVDIEALRERTYPSLSGGERARAAFARIMAQASPLMLLDEPTAAMDIRHQELVLRLARDYAQTGCGVVIVLHALDAAAAYADRVILLHDGTVDCSGPPADVLTSERLTRVYQHPIDVFDHPHTHTPVITPRRHYAE